jgi:hydroxyethylthiazole kinase-like uncharacterized protein yjeF
MLTTAEMKKLEELSEKHGVPNEKLMENAGKAAFQIIKTNFDLRKAKVLIVCYHGNNGGDGFVLARHLAKECEVKVLFVGEESKLKDEAKAAFEKLDKKLVVKEFEETEEHYDLVIDALLGTGTKGQIKEPIRSGITSINNRDALIMSLDIPTGVDPDTGEVLDIAVQPSLVITFHDKKPGLKEFDNRVVIADIGIPKKAIEESLK